MTLKPLRVCDRCHTEERQEAPLFGGLGNIVPAGWTTVSRRGEDPRSADDRRDLRPGADYDLCVACWAAFDRFMAGPTEADAPPAAR